jgi:hypothetical protein
MVIVRGRLEPQVGALFTKALAATRETLRSRTPYVSVDMCTKNVSAEAPTGMDTWRNGIADVSTDARGLLAPPQSPTPDDAPADLRAQNEAQGLRIHPRTTMPSWPGDRLDLGYAIDVLRPRDGS